MKSIGKKLIMLSFLLALIATITIYVYLQSFKTTQNPMKKIKILVAATTIPPRTIIDKKMVQEVLVSEDLIFKDYIKDTTKIIGKYSKDTIIKNEGFNSENLISKGSDEISIKIDENHRALSINVTGASAVSDLIKPGDNVDIVLFVLEKKDLDKIINKDTAKIIMQNVKVLAVDKIINRESKAKASTDTASKVPPTFLVSLSVPIIDVEKLVLAENVGNLKLVLRPLNKEDDIDAKGAIWEDVIDNKDTAPAAPSAIDNSKAEVKDTTYTVKRGDTLRTISLAFYGDTENFYLILKANNIENENQIITGQVIKIPKNK